MFKSKKNTNTIEELIDVSTYPIGVILSYRTKYYLTSNKGILEFLTKRMMTTWKLPVVTLGNAEPFSPIAKIGFRDGTLIKNVEDGRLYLISGSKRRQITDPDWLRLLGLTDSDILWVSGKETELHGRGDDLA